jgi:hypothetical protein
MLDKDAGAWVHRQAELQAQTTRQEQRFREVEAEWVERYEKLEAEVGRLTVELTHRVGWEERCLDAEAALATLRAENARLRAALSEMLESFTDPGDDNDILRRARAALDRDKAVTDHEFQPSKRGDSCDFTETPGALDISNSL